MTSAADVIRAHLQAFSDRDLPAMLATMAPDAVFVTGTSRIEPADFADFFGEAMQTIDPTMQVTRVVADGPDVACEFVETVTLDGVRRSLNRAAFYVVDAGVITSATVYDQRDDG